MDTKNSHLEVAILVKQDHLGCISTLTHQDEMLIMRYDSRMTDIAVNKFSVTAGSEVFSKAVETSKQRGWQVVYVGQPLWG